LGGLAMDVWGVTAVFRLGSFSIMVAMLLVLVVQTIRPELWNPRVND